MVTRVYPFVPIVILIAAPACGESKIQLKGGFTLQHLALVTGYSVIRAGTRAIAAAAVVSWLTPHRMGRAPSRSPSRRAG
jgi:hypothetical protein